MGTQAYVGTSKRTFQQAVLRLLETDYGLLGSRRVLAMLAEDIQQLVDEFYPATERLSSGGSIVLTSSEAALKLCSAVRRCLLRLIVWVRTTLRGHTMAKTRMLLTTCS